MAYENFLGYTEVDPGDYITVTASRVTHIAWNNSTNYVYKDFEAGHFGDFTHLLTIEVTGYPTNRSRIHWMMANALGDYVGLLGGTFIEIEARSALGIVRMVERHSATSYSDNTFAGSINTPYYLTITKAGTALSCKIYTDAARTALAHTLSLTLQANHTFRYLYATNSWNAGDAESCDGYTENLDIGEAVAAAKPLGLGLQPAPKGGTGRPALITGGASFGG